MNAPRTPILLTLLTLTAGCAVGPDYQRPEAPQPDAFKEAWQPGVPADDKPRGPWWQAYGDPALDELEQNALRSNQTLQAAAAQYRGALAAVTGARAGLFPTVGVGVGSTRAYAASKVGTGSGSTSLVGNTQTIDHLTGSLSWEIDLWGGLRRTLEQSKASAAASAGDLAAAQLSVQAAVAQDYVQLRAIDLQLALLKRTTAAYEKSLTITRNRYAAGVAPSTDVTQAESQLASAVAEAADLAAQRAPLEHALAALQGRTPEAFALTGGALLPALPPVPSVLPATLLQRRPDIAAAERRVAAANAGIGVARAAWFPTLSLSGTGGWQGPQWNNLISAPAEFWSVGPSLAGTLFDAGARSAQNAEARANYDAAVANYRQTVLTALTEAEDALATLRELAAEEVALTSSVTAARKTLQATENQYRAGTVSYLNVVIAENTLLAAEVSLIGVQSRRLLAHVGLLKAMGGAPVAAATPAPADASPPKG